MPTVSVVMPSYNHEKYVGEAIESVLGQTLQDFEFVIADDGSSDSTVFEIKKFEDPRIKLFCFPKNMGADVAANHCISVAKGKYIAMLSSDDVFMSNKLEEQVSYLEDHPEIGMAFSHAETVDERGNSKEHFYSTMFDKVNRSRHEWVNYFFYNGNCLCHTSMLVRKSVFEDIGLYNPCYAQLSDFDFWIRASMKYELHIHDKKLTKLRIRDGEMNASGDRVENKIRAEWEYKHIIRNFFDIRSVDELLKIFPGLKNKYTEFTEALIPYYVARLCLETRSHYHAFSALEVLYDLLQNSPDALREKVNFSYPDFFDLVVSADVFHQLAIRKLNDLMRNA